MEALRFGSGQAVRRVEDPALVQGQGRFTDDVAPAGQLVARFVRSTQAHGRLLSVDVAAARQLPGVVAVYTGADLEAAGVKPFVLPPAFPRPDGKPMAGPARPVLAVGDVRFVGEPIALVVAESKEAARAAADAVTAEYASRPAVVDVRAAYAPGAPLILPDLGDNISAEMRHGDAAATDAAFATAAHVVKLDLVNQRLHPNPMEPRSLLAWVAEDGRLTMRASSQMPTALRDGVAGMVPGLSPEKVRVLVGDVGGGFGMKTGLYAEDVAVAYAAVQTKRPVKWQAERLDDFLAGHGRDVKSWPNWRSAQWQGAGPARARWPAWAPIRRW